MEHCSPLRYPGGKACLARYLGRVLKANRLLDGVYIEPFAGGSGAALFLLFSEYVDEIWLNDLDYNIWCFWKSALDHTQEFIDLIQSTPVTVSEWHKQKAVLKNKRVNSLRRGFATFFVNRTNRSGALNGGPIGGLDQSGPYKINARYNRNQLCERIDKVGLFRERIHLSQDDAISFLRRLWRTNVLQRALVYLDPPYFEKGERLYRKHFNLKDHARLAGYLNSQVTFRWLVSYDDVPDIHALYSHQPAKKVINMNYFMHRRKVGRELLIGSAHCELPDVSEQNSLLSLAARHTDLARIKLGVAAC
jgi:DNA adenine methylase